PPSRSSTASWAPVDAPDGTMALPLAPDSRNTSTSTVGFPRESRTSRPLTCSMALIGPPPSAVAPLSRALCPWVRSPPARSLVPVTPVTGVTTVADGVRPVRDTDAGGVTLHHQRGTVPFRELRSRPIPRNGPDFTPDMREILELRF